MTSSKLFLSLLIVLSSTLLLLKSNGTNKLWEAPAMIYPEDNPFSIEVIDFGGSLFFETLLSRDRSVSCQSCHLLKQAFADHLPVGEGIDGRKVTRNTPSLFNVGYHPLLMKDGKFNSLEEQVLGPINDHREFDLNPKEVEERIAALPMYQELCQKAFGEPVSIENIQKALANFQRVLISDKSSFDDYMKGHMDSISESAKRGFKLFSSDKLNCTACHNGFDFTDYSFQNNGVYTVYADSGRALISKIPSDLGKFKVPSLRNIALTYPYMHDGSIDNLEDVILNYSKGGSRHKNQSKEIKAFEINDNEMTDLISFMESLTEKRLLIKDEE